MFEQGDAGWEDGSVEHGDVEMEVLARARVRSVQRGELYRWWRSMGRDTRQITIPMEITRNV